MALESKFVNLLSFEATGVVLGRKNSLKILAKNKYLSSENLNLNKDFPGKSKTILGWHQFRNGEPTELDRPKRCSS